jgi:hypothetical protein
MSEQAGTSEHWTIEETGGNLYIVAGKEVIADLGRVAAHKWLKAGLMAAAPDLADGHREIADMAKSGLDSLAVGDTEGAHIALEQIRERAVALYARAWRP